MGVFRTPTFTPRASVEILRIVALQKVATDEGNGARRERRIARTSSRTVFDPPAVRRARDPRFDSTFKAGIPNATSVGMLLAQLKHLNEFIERGN
jgi:hypothetical protein